MNTSTPKANFPCKKVSPDPSASDFTGRNTPAFTKSYEETFDFGMVLGRALKPGDVVALDGELGAGKTCLCAGICRALGVTEPVTSPTYTIVHEYEGRVPVYHIDAYRISGAEDFEASCGGEILYGEGVCLVEWGGRIAECLPADTIYVEIRISSGGGRGITVNKGTDCRMLN
ncbi:MAG: tRNA (adenosine(37)-N6)-threonylcarbamoyltransferase complex ATPase subunit type 1 TsaE [Spirochaetaceae bacterium]|nr:tRNA (adenosine(37)-N6)-threonylcarbamoyltransferase complex ATPase subunit type 1 TsaE [Spirochaetaceae bacterium]